MRYRVHKPCGIQGVNYSDGDTLVDPSPDVVRSLTIFGAIGPPITEDPPAAVVSVAVHAVPVPDVKAPARPDRNSHKKADRPSK